MQICKRKILGFAVFFIFFSIFDVSAYVPVKATASEAKKMRLDLVNYSKQFIGCPYVSGGIGPDNFDCSGLIYTCSREAIQVQLPRKVLAIFNYCDEIEDKDLEAGDLVFFKTTESGVVSHVGLYLGRNQFIHAASDGPNTGVIISSLKENYWKTHYYKAGRFLPSSKSAELSKVTSDEKSSSADKEKNKEEATTSSEEKNVKKNTSSEVTTSVLKKNGFMGKLDIETTLFMGWNFFTAKNLNFVFHGLDAKVAARYVGVFPEPFLAADLNWEYATGVVQIPIEIGLAFNPYVRFYFGPILTIGDPHPASKMFDLDDDDTRIDAVVMPGILGIEFQTPRIKTKLFNVTFVQDIHYIFYSKTDGSALDFKEGMGNGFVFATGIRAIF